MAEPFGYVTLDECVASATDEGEISANRRYKLWQLAFRAMEQLGIDFFFGIESQKLPISSTKTVQLPDDILQWTKVGVLNNRGEITPLKYNNKLTKYADLLPGRISQTEDGTIIDLLQSGTVWYNYWNGDGFSNLYGLPSGEPFVGSFNIDFDNGVIILDPNFNYDYLMLEYVKSPRAGGDYKVPVQFKETVIAFIQWKNLPSKMVGSGQWANLKHNYYNERRLANARWNPIRLEQAYEWSLENTRLTVKA